MSGRFRRFLDRFPLAALGIEVFSIVLGVLLALTVNEWREARNNRRLAETALVNIQQEVQQNREILQRRYPYHAAALDSMRSLSSRIDEGIRPQEIRGEDVGLPQGGQFWDLNAAAYQTAQSSGMLSHLDYETLSLIMSIYEMQETLESYDTRLMDVMMDPQNLQPGLLYYALTIAPGLMTDVVNSEQTLLALYNRFLQADATATDSVQADTAAVN